MNKRDIVSISFAIFILSTIILFFNIQKGEVQPWDEGLYAYRAREILNNHCWWDQTSVSLGNLYSSTYPPLVPWVMALNMKLFGTNLFAIRLFSVLSSALLITLFFYFFSSLFNYQLSFLLSINLLISNVYFFYSRQGMLDIPLLLFIFLTFILLYKYLESDKKYQKVIYGAGTSFFFACSLMTKVVLSFIPLISLPFIYKYFPKKKFAQSILLFSLGILIALPWHLYMSLKYGSEFLSVFLPAHIYSAVESNTKQLGLLYYINQLLTSNALLILAFLYLFVRFYKYGTKYFFFNGNFISDIFFAWFFVGLIIFSFAPTKLPHYTLYLLLPGIYLSLEFLCLEFAELSRKWKFITFSLFFVALMWQLSPNLRLSIKFFSFNAFPYQILILFIVLLLTYLIYFLEKEAKIKQILNTKLFETIIYIVSISLLVSTIVQISQKPTGKIFGGERVAKFLDNHKINHFVYLFHKANDSDTLNPQLAWYTNGSYFGKDPKKKIFFVNLPLEGINFQTIENLSNFPNNIVVYYIFDYLPNIEATIREISIRRQILLITPSYIIFSPEKPKWKIKTNEISI